MECLSLIASVLAFYLLVQVFGLGQGVVSAFGGGFEEGGAFSRQGIQLRSPSGGEPVRFDF